ncbi:MAG: hypothetical protein JWP35_719 [Caulobacter sp.]|nr:hypothetical protein [Caulobacter sp.]
MLTRRSMLLTPVAAGAVMTLGGMSQQTIDGGLYNPGHYENNDPAWSLFNEAQVTGDTTKGEYRAAFPPGLIRLQGQRFSVSGFMMPLEPAPQTLHFALLRRNTACPFCPANKPTEAVEIYSRGLVKYTGEEIAVKGTLRLISSSADGLFFRLDDTVVTGG